jgi:hypothetical protein
MVVRAGVSGSIEVYIFFANRLIVFGDIAVLPLPYKYNNTWNWQCQHPQKSAGDPKRSGGPGPDENPPLQYLEKNLITSSN